MPTACRAALAAALLISPVFAAQGPVFQTPGMPRTQSPAATPSSVPDTGQADRFSSVFNPSFSFVIDTLVDSIRASGSSPDGENAELRTLEFAAQSWVDPKAWAYFVAATEGEEVAIEEAAVHYTGLGGHHTLRAGRFFVDFGKQMQTHVHELRTPERPLVLRTLLGEEVKGDGVQWDSWTAIGDETALRWSVGAFANLLPEEPEDFDASSAATRSVAERKGIEDFGLTARLTGFTDISTNGVLQVGASVRVLPDFTLAFEPSGSAASGLDETVLGFDATYGWTSDTGLRSWTLGGEFLLATGDTYARIDEGGTPGDPSDDGVDPASDRLAGFYAYCDLGLDRSSSVGVQFSRVELPVSGTPAASEIEGYYTRMLSEFHRLRFAVVGADFEEGEDSLRFAVQYSAFLGAHGHGINW